MILMMFELMTIIIRYSCVRQNRTLCGNTSLNLLVLGCRRRNIVDSDVVTAVVNVFIVADDDVEED